MTRVAIFGATSYLAEHVARLYAADGAQLFLAGRSEAKLLSIASDLSIRGASQVHHQTVDFNNAAALPPLVDCMLKSLGGSVDHVLIAYGVLGDQQTSEGSPDQTRLELETNFISPALLLTSLAPAFERQKSGTIGVISSVAGDVGRRSNYIYGSAKSGLSAFTQGLRSRMHPFGVKVITIKPGPVETPMTVAIKNRPMASAVSVATTIHRAMLRGAPDILYTPAIFWPIMTLIKALPESLKKRLKF